MNLRPRAGYCLALGVGLVALCACSGSADTAGPPSTLPNTSLQSTPVTVPPSTSIPTGGLALTLASAAPANPGTNYKLVAQVGPRFPGGDIFVSEAVDPKGALVGALGKETTSEAINPQAAVLFDPVHRKLSYLSTGHYSGPPRQITGMVASSRWVAWIETTSSNLEFNPWKLFSYDRLNGKLRQIASAPTTRNGLVPAAPGYTLPSLGSDGRVYLDAVQQIGATKYQNYVESVPLDGSAPLRKEGIGTGPMASANSLVWSTGPDGKIIIMRKNIATGVSTQIFDSAGTSCRKIFGLGVAGNVEAWGLRCAGTDVIQVLQAGTVVATIRGSNFGYLRVTSRYVGFAPGSGPYDQYIYDVRAHKLLKIGTGMLAGDMPGNGPFLTWGSYPTAQSYRQVHVALLSN